VPQRFHRARLSDFDERLMWFESVVAWSERSDMRRNAVIIGPVGTGKSHLAAATCRPACAAGLDVRMIGTAKLLDMLRPGGPDGALDRLIDIDRLIIDDVGAEKPTDWTAERFTLLVDERWSEERPTVFTTNLAPPDLAAHVGERCYSRMVGGALAVELTGADRRRAR
jgi:DNA replication protein DnaC